MGRTLKYCAWSDGCASVVVGAADHKAAGQGTRRSRSDMADAERRVGMLAYEDDASYEQGQSAVPASAPLPGYQQPDEHGGIANSG